ncbi:MAG: hypothetical protein QM405_00685 [Euryarchaeota archaeon]|nr:hypothetical protein [Euryarchaeota archaeon]
MRSGGPGQQRAGSSDPPPRLRVHLSPALGPVAAISGFLITSKGGGVHISHPIRNRGKWMVKWW